MTSHDRHLGIKLIGNSNKLQDQAYLNRRKHTISLPRVAGEDILIESVADRSSSRCDSVLYLIQKLVQRWEVVSLQRFLASSAFDPGVADTLSRLLVTSSTGRATNITSAVYDIQQGAFTLLKLWQKLLIVMY